MRMSVAAKLTAFAADETGVVSVDWMVISAACIGLSLATVSVVSGGFDDLSADVASSLAGRPLIDNFHDTGASAWVLADTGFSAGLDGWGGDGTITTVAGFGDILVIDPGGTVETTLSLPEGARTAEIRFDLVGADALSGAASEIWVNGVAIGIARVEAGTAVFEAPPGAPVTAMLAAGGRDLGAGLAPDAVLSVAVAIADPGDTLTLSVRSGSDTAMAQGFFAIDNVVVAAA